MSGTSRRKSFGRRSFLKGAGAALMASAGAGLMPGFLRRGLFPDGVGTASAAEPAPDLFFAGTDGWISLPQFPKIGVFHPDRLAPAPFTTYIFGFRNVTGMDAATRIAQKNKAQHSAPMFWVDEYIPAAPKDFRIRLTNLGLALRPDLFDAHTIHWHGFRNVIPFFDGEPTGSVAVKAGTVFTYVYRPRDPGTYMFHCHVEDVEHVHMGMTGPVFVRPRQNLGRPLLGIPAARVAGGEPTAPMGYAYNDEVLPGDPRSTAYDREFAMFLSEVWAEAHWADAHIQLPEWSDYRADFALLNGRVYPDTLLPNAEIDLATSQNALSVKLDASGDLVAPAGRPDLKHQPLSALVRCNAGERVLLRFANLGFKEAAMTLAGIRMKVVGKDATPMRNLDGTETSYDVNTVSFGAGESIDAIFQAPALKVPRPISDPGYDTYVLYNRNYQRSNNLGRQALAGAGAFGGQRTEVRVYGGASSLPPQSVPNT